MGTVEQSLGGSPSGSGTNETVVMGKCLAVGHLTFCSTEHRVQTQAGSIVWVTGSLAPDTGLPASLLA